MGLFLLDYGAGNVQSLANTLESLGHSFKWISSPADFDDATVSIAIIRTSLSFSLVIVPSS
jgi:imidazoleglycerol phosphate synthase glutamine amidotransferase subunit HisH